VTPSIGIMELMIILVALAFICLNIEAGELGKITQYKSTDKFVLGNKGTQGYPVIIPSFKIHKDSSEYEEGVDYYALVVYDVGSCKKSTSKCDDIENGYVFIYNGNDLEDYSDWRYDDMSNKRFGNDIEYLVKNYNMRFGVFYPWSSDFFEIVSSVNKDQGSTSKDGSEQLNSYEASIMYAIYTQLYMKKSSKNFGWSDYVKYIKQQKNYEDVLEMIEQSENVYGDVVNKKDEFKKDVERYKISQLQPQKPQLKPRPQQCNEEELEKKYAELQKELDETKSSHQDEMNAMRNRNRNFFRKNRNLQNDVEQCDQKKEEAVERSDKLAGMVAKLQTKAQSYGYTSVFDNTGKGGKGFTHDGHNEL